MEVKEDDHWTTEYDSLSEKLSHLEQIYQYIVLHTFPTSLKELLLHM